MHSIEYNNIDSIMKSTLCIEKSIRGTYNHRMFDLNQEQLILIIKMSNELLGKVETDELCKKHGIINNYA